eukprot:41245-Eustigmatos_ZCMA.PRE.1
MDLTCGTWSHGTGRDVQPDAALHSSYVIKPLLMSYTHTSAFPSHYDRIGWRWRSRRSSVRPLQPRLRCHQ